MVNSCVVTGCTKRYGRDGVKRKFFDIPRVIQHQGTRTEELSRERRMLWLKRIYRKDYDPDPNKRHNKVCSDHFVSGMKADLYDNTNPDWAPSLHMGTETRDVGNKETAKQRYDRVEQRREKKNVFIAVEGLLNLRIDQHRNDIDHHQLYESVEVVEGNRCKFLLLGRLEPEPKGHDPEMCRKIRAECQTLTTENITLKGKLRSATFSPESLSKCPEKLKHYTGLTYNALMAVYEFVSEYIPGSSKSVLTKFEKLMLVLMKLRLNLSVQDLGYRFMVSASCVSKTFNDVIHIMYVRMQELILWPDREELRMSMPMEFRKYFGLKVSIIIDCFEIFIERPSNFEARAQTWSNYKHHNTAKYLIGITPQGAVSFLSDGYGGRASDKFVTEDCGLLNKLLPGDIVLADRGFDIKDMVGLRCAEVKIPAFTKGKKQLSPVALETTRKIAHTRIHVERVIGLVRNKYTVLQSIIPIDYLMSRSDTVPTIDKIVTVCCALSNCCESVVPFD